MPWADSTKDTAPLRLHMAKTRVTVCGKLGFLKGELSVICQGAAFEVINWKCLVHFGFYGRVHVK